MLNSDATSLCIVLHCCEHEYNFFFFFELIMLYNEVQFVSIFNALGMK